MSNRFEAKTLHMPSSVKSLPQSWTWRRLDDICLTIVDCPHSTPKISSDGPLMVRTQDILSGTFRAENAAHVSEATYQERIKRAEPTEGDLLYSREGTYFGIAAEVPSNVRVCLGQRMVLLRPDPTQIYFRFLRYWLNSSLITSHVYGQRDGSVAERLNLPTIRGLPIPLPPLPEQRAIAHILGPLDDKIELNQRMNDTLEGIAQALFKSWFVDFDPVKAKAKAEGREPEGMDVATAALFPSNFTNSPPEHIPEGWTAETLERVSFLNSESWSRNNTPDQIEYVDLANTKWGTIESTQIFSWKDAPSRAQRILRKGDTIVGTVRPGNGSYSFISLDGLTGSTGFAVLRPKEAFYREFVYLSATSTENIARLAHLADGAAYPAVRPDVVYATPILFPGDEILLRFSQCLSPIMEKVEINKKENKVLGDIRDLLLPRLISGKLRVGESSETVEALAS